MTSILGPANKPETWSCSERNFAAQEHVEFAENEGEYLLRSPQDMEWALNPPAHSFLQTPHWIFCLRCFSHLSSFWTDLLGGFFSKCCFYHLPSERTV